MTRWLLLALVAWLPACANPDAEEICEELTETCGEALTSCLTDGMATEARARETDCEPTYDAYLDCIVEAGCRWRFECETAQAALASCTSAQAQP